MADNKLILVVDDDPISGDLTSFLLKDAGYDVIYLQDNRATLDTVRNKKPSLVILDMLMPGPDGLSLCRQIKSDPVMRGTKTVIVSGKNFDQDKALALKSGAEDFITKPYDVEGFAKSITKILERQTTAQMTLAAKPAAEASPSGIISVVVRGSRSPWTGAAPAPASQYGRNTSCLSVRVKEDLIVLDAGSGILSLGEELLREGMPKSIIMILSHLHQDHVEGLARFASSLSKDVFLRLSAPQGAGLEKFLDTALPQEFQAPLEIREISPGGYEIKPGIRLEAFTVKHPEAALGVSLLAHGLKLVYCPDNELGDPLDEILVERCAAADLLIHDSRYDVPEHAAHRGQGHSSWVGAVDLAVRANVKHLLLFHLDSLYDDPALDRIAASAAERVAKKGRAFPCAVAREGLKIAL